MFFSITSHRGYWKGRDVAALYQVSTRTHTLWSVRGLNEMLNITLLGSATFILCSMSSCRFITFTAWNRLIRTTELWLFLRRRDMSNVRQQHSATCPLCSHEEFFGSAQQGQSKQYNNLHLQTFLPFIHADWCIFAMWNCFGISVPRTNLWSFNELSSIGGLRLRRHCLQIILQE